MAEEAACHHHSHVLHLRSTMKTATVRDLRNHHTTLLAKLDEAHIMGATRFLTFDANQRRLAGAAGFELPL
jgi:hypothetical protein